MRERINQRIEVYKAKVLQEDMRTVVQLQDAKQTLRMLEDKHQRCQGAFYTIAEIQKYMAEADSPEGDGAMRTLEGMKVEEIPVKPKKKTPKEPPK